MSDKRFLEIELKKLRIEQLYEYGVDFEKRRITINEEITSETFYHLDAAMSELERDSRKRITIRINSPGGSTYDAMAIVGRLASSPCKITTEAYGHCMSSAVLILACGDHRRMSQYCWLMQHKSSYALSGDHDKIAEEVRHMEREEHAWAHWMEEFSQANSKYWLTAYTKKNFYMNAYQSLQLGVIDEII